MIDKTVSFVIGKGSTKWKGPHHQNCGFVDQWIDSTIVQVGESGALSSSHVFVRYRLCKFSRARI